MHVYLLVIVMCVVLPQQLRANIPISPAKTAASEGGEEPIPCAGLRRALALSHPLFDLTLLRRLRDSAPTSLSLARQTTRVTHSKTDCINLHYLIHINAYVA